jgi:CRISPR type III-A-associated protein Csm2
MVNVGDVFGGTVSRIKDIGAFVTFTAGQEAFEGLIRRKDWPNDLSVGDKISVKIKERRSDGKIDLAPVGSPAAKASPAATTKSKLDWWKLGASFYSDKANGVLNEELFTVFAKKLAEESANAKDKELTTNALRNFYDAVKAIENPILQAGSRAEKIKVFNRQLPHIKLLEAKVAHYRPQKSPKIPQIFAKFLEDSIRIINSLEEFEGFVLVFEAVAGWHTKYAKKGDN